MNEVLLVLAALAATAIAVIFWGFHRRRPDRFFALFAVAFLALAVNRVLLLIVDDRGETGGAVYLVRAAAFGLIIVAVVDRNRAGTS